MHRWGLFSGIAAVAAFAIAIVSSLPAGGATTVTRLSTDPYSNSASRHQTEVEPDSFAYGSTIVDAFQVGRIYDGGSANIGWARSGDGGTTWTNGFLPGTTKTATPAGTYDRVTDPSVAYDAAHATWLVVTLAMTGSTGTGVLAAPSKDDGVTFASPVRVTSKPSGDLDKTWVVCDNNANSSFRGHCYAEWDDHGAGNIIYMSTSTDGGQTWSTPSRPAAGGAGTTGLGGQPLVQPDGKVIVPIDNAFSTSVLAFTSTNGGSSWGPTVTVSTIKDHTEAGTLRSGPLVSAEIDGDGKVYVAWQDCRFRKKCSSNDIVMSTSTDGTTWTPPARIPIDRIDTTVDHFLPGIGVDPTTTGSGVKIGLLYHYYPVSGCGSSCQLNVGFVSSGDGGNTWSSPAQIAGPMPLIQLVWTSQGYMVGDYFSTSFVGGKAYPVFSIGNKRPTISTYDQAAYTTGDGFTPAGTTATAAAATATSAGEQPQPDAKSDHDEPKEPQTIR